MSPQPTKMTSSCTTAAILLYLSSTVTGFGVLPSTSSRSHQLKPLHQDSVSSTSSNEHFSPLDDCSFAGNAHFDPLALASSRSKLWLYREAEIKHARLAMLAAVGLPLSHLFDVEMASLLDGDSMFSFWTQPEWQHVADRVAPVWWGLCLGFMAVLEEETASADVSAVQFRGDYSYVPGKLNFDPLGVFPASKKGQKAMLRAEIWHGRVAMLGMALYFAQELVWPVPEAQALLNLILE